MTDLLMEISHQKSHHSGDSGAQNTLFLALYFAFLWTFPWRTLQLYAKARCDRHLSIYDNLDASALYHFHDVFHDGALHVQIWANRNDRHEALDSLSIRGSGIDVDGYVHDGVGVCWSCQAHGSDCAFFHNRDIQRRDVYVHVLDDGNDEGAHGEPFLSQFTDSNNNKMTSAAHKQWVRYLTFLDEHPQVRYDRW